MTMPDCIMACEPDCEIGPLHCANWHRSSREPDWHEPAPCDARELWGQGPRRLRLVTGDEEDDDWLWR